MPPKPIGEVRRSQIVTTYGVGAIVAVEDESFMVAGIDRWDVEKANVHEPRLERRLGVPGFVTPPATEGGTDIPVVRFPQMVSCPGCNRLEHHGFFTTFDSNQCNRCSRPLVPSRFVMVCRRGHIDEFPYFRWVHAGSQASGDRHEMSIDAGGVTASLRDITISCSCGKSATLDGAFGKFALRDVSKCTARRPWLGGGTEDCAETPRVLQRGGSNVWFPVPASALSIPPRSEGAFELLNPHWSRLRHIPADAVGPTLAGLRLAEGTGYSLGDLVLAVSQRNRQEGTGDAPSEASLKRDEYEALERGKEQTVEHQDFVCVPANGVGGWTARAVDLVMVAKRLREVRALTAFTRILPPSQADPEENRAPLSGGATGWLPAIEVTGEGVFLRLAAERLIEWERRPSVRKRAALIDGHYARRFLETNRAPDRVVTPRLLLLHTLAHVLITQWSLECGYPASSLRERLYVGEDMAGLLIYTATSDSAGSLGGVVAQADPGRLDRTMWEAVNAATWCSADPLCIEADAAGVDSLNLGACHACVLLPEVCCEEMNTLLDRGMLIGMPGDPTTAFFSTADLAG